MSQLSPDAFAERFTACSRTLWCIAAAILGDPHDAEDVLQEAALIALRKLEEFDPATAFTAWMRQIVRYVALNKARRRAQDKGVSIDPETLNGKVHRPARLTGRGELPGGQEAFDDQTLAALRELDETARACLLLRVVLELPYREISRALDVPEGTAMSHVHRARRTLSEKLAPSLPAAPTRSGDAHG